MVARPVALGLALVSTMTFAADVAARSHVPPISSISISENGAWTDRISGHETPEMCQTFQLKGTDVRDYFRTARRVSDREYGHDLAAAMCFAEGKLTFRDGSTGNWNIDQARRGLLTLPNGKTYYYYCPKCRAKVFPPPP